MDNSVGVPATDQRPVPSVIDLVLPVEGLHINVIKFNRLGTLIAAGAVNGCLAMIDFTTKRTSNIWNAHVLGVTSISWSRDGRQIFSTALDNTYVISDVASGTVIEHILVGQGLISALLNPRNSNNVLFNTNLGIKLTNMKEKLSQKLEVFHPDDPISTSIFEHRGQYIIAGTAKGSILTYDLTGKVVSSGSIDNPQTIRSIFATRRLGLILVVSTDRFIRVYEFTELLKQKETFDTENRLCDPSNKTVWQSVCASGEADYVAGMSATSHMITIFERVTGTIVATLCESKKEIPLSFDWHPAKPAVASVCNGQIFIWKQKPKPSWAAYAPHFTELGENMFYKEKESEFDQYDEDIPKEDSSTMRSGEAIIDIETTKAPSPLCSSDDEDPNRIGTSLAAVNVNLEERTRSSRPRFPLSMVMNPDAAYDTSINLAPIIEHRRIPFPQTSTVHENGEGLGNGYISPINGVAKSPIQNGDIEHRPQSRRKSSTSSGGNERNVSTEKSASHDSKTSDKQVKENWSPISDLSSDSPQPGPSNVQQSSKKSRSPSPISSDEEESLGPKEKSKTKCSDHESNPKTKSSDRNPRNKSKSESSDSDFDSRRKSRSISSISSDSSNSGPRRKRRRAKSSSSSSSNVSHKWDSP